MVMTHLSRETRTVTILEYKHSKFTKDAESEHADVNTNNWLNYHVAAGLYIHSLQSLTLGFDPQNFHGIG